MSYMYMQPVSTIRWKYWTNPGGHFDRQGTKYDIILPDMQDRFIPT